MVELVAMYRDRVFRHCYRMLNHRQDAEDITQETFIRVFKALHQWDSNRAFEPWLITIASNRCRTAMSSRMRKPTPQTLVGPVVDEAPDHQAAQRLAEEVQLALQNLRDEYRQIFVLFHEQELSYGEIADMMNCPVGTIKTWLHRARKELIAFLQQRGVFEETANALP